jgi:c-di-GMP-binding flagellar brake protein YcgR
MTPSKNVPLGSDLKARKDRRFKQWNRTEILLMKDPRHTHGRTPVEAFTYDISIGGARIHAAEPFEAGSHLRLQIELVRSGEVLRVEGLVKWQRRDETAKVYELGVEFQHTSMATVLSLMKALHEARGPQAPGKSEAAALNGSGRP